MDNEKQVQKLHLHTIDSLCNDLIGGHSVEYGDGNTYSLTAPARSILAWYNQDHGKWKKNVQRADAEAVASSIDTPAAELEAYPLATDDSNRKELKLVKLRAHRFAGIHSYGSAENPPEVFEFEPQKPLSLFEGYNGSGKTSILNSIIWCLTGQLIRPQREPEDSDIEFEIEIQRAGESASRHLIPPVTPLPNTSEFLPEADQRKLPVETWVELTFQDQNGNLLPPIKRTVQRTGNTNVRETPPNLENLGVDPISIKLGTTIPSLIPFIQIGSKSELGEAVADLTGLSSLIFLSKHSTKVSKRITDDFKKAEETEIDKIKTEYLEVTNSLISKVEEHSSLKSDLKTPDIENTEDFEEDLGALQSHFEECKANSYEDAKSILGQDFDTSDQIQLKALEDKIAPAISKLAEIKDLPSAARLSSLGNVSEEKLDSATQLLTRICDEARTLCDLAAEPDIAKRKKLYARVAEWIKEFDLEAEAANSCPICERELEGITDSTTGTPIATHICDSLEENSELISQSIPNWIEACKGILARDLEPALQFELNNELPDHPEDLINAAISRELFDSPAFADPIGLLRPNMGKLFEQTFKEVDRLEGAGLTHLPDYVISISGDLEKMLLNLERAIEFSKWRKSNQDRCIEIAQSIIGSQSEPGEIPSLSEVSPLLDRLNALAAIIKSAEPINECTGFLTELTSLFNRRLTSIAKIEKYETAVSALAEIIGLGNLAAQQVEDLQNELKSATEKWRDEVYQNVYIDSGHKLQDTSVAAEGQLKISVGSHGASAPAEHVSNASALRATLVGFYIAFWEHVYSNRGGIRLMLLDDPHELLDDENQQNLANALTKIVDIGGQLIVTTYDNRFASKTVQACKQNSCAEHYSVHPVSIGRNRIETPLAIEALERKKKEYEEDRNDQGKASDYAAECRIYIEARLTDLFDNPRYAQSNPKPTLMDNVNHARGLRTADPSHEFFSSVPFRNFCNDPALENNSDCLALLNKAHHEGKRHITPVEVNNVSEDLVRIVKLSDKLHDEFLLWRKRAHSEDESAENVIELETISSAENSIQIVPDLAAFTGELPTLESQDGEHEVFDCGWFNGKALFLLRNNMFGFSAPAGSFVIVEAEGEQPSDHSLVVAHYNGCFIARRLLRNSNDSRFVTLSTAIPDPRIRPPSLQLKTSQAVMFKVVGVMFGGNVPFIPNPQGDAFPTTDESLINQLITCHRVRDNSAEPLALNGQLVLGGAEIPLDQVSAYEGKYVAIALQSGAGIFKRIGKALPDGLEHLRQFESIGGKGNSEILSLSSDPAVSAGFDCIATIREVRGVIYTE